MTQLNICGEGIAESGTFRVLTAIIRLKKGYIVLITDQDDYSLGTIVLSGPALLEGTGSISSPLPVLGFKNTSLANMVGKIASQKLNQPVLSLLYITEQSLKQEIIMKTTITSLMNAIEHVLSQKK